MSHKAENFFIGLVVGGVIGAVVGVLFAPKSGKELRDEIGAKADEVMSKAREEYLDKLEKTTKAYDAALSRLNKIEAAAGEKIGELGNKASSLFKKEIA